ncbi:unnamed protein product [Rotaria sp. Silwood1]|nr:unnamed protein product [Rotaria sp. Silwood1]
MLDFCRLHDDQHVLYDDGGGDFLVYPVCIHEQLPVTERHHTRLLDVIHDLSERRRDFHPYPLPAEDIIDPDLLPSRPGSTVDRNRWLERLLKQLRHSSDYKQ